jgi:hypothetical protein
VLRGDFAVRLGEGGPVVYVHQAVCGPRSAFFHSLFRSGQCMAERDGLTLRLDPLPTLPSLLSLLRYVYTSQTRHVTPLHALDLLPLIGAEGEGGFLQLHHAEPLRRRCLECLGDGVTVESVVPLLCRAHCIGNQVCAPQADRPSWINAGI